MSIDDWVVRLAKRIRERGHEEVEITRQVVGVSGAIEVARALGLYCYVRGPRDHFVLSPRRPGPPDKRGYPMLLHPSH